jgi:anti-sigma-K factor RskA
VSSREENRGCEQSVDAAPYVLGALADADADSYREHLAECSSCRAEVAELQSVVDTLPASVPAIRAPEALRERVLATVRSEAELLKAAQSPAGQAPARAGRRRSLRVSLLGAGLAIAATAALAVAITVGLSSGTAVRVRTAQIAPNIPGAHASLRLKGGHAELVVSGMPQPPVGDIYEVWLARSASSVQPTDALFGVTNGGSGSVNVPGDLHGIQLVMVTREPRGGSPQPTSPPLLRVTL